MTPKTLFASLIEESSAELDLSSSEFEPLSDPGPDFEVVSGVRVGAGVIATEGAGVGTTEGAGVVTTEGAGVGTTEGAGAAIRAEADVATFGIGKCAGFEGGCCTGGIGAPSDVSALTTPVSAKSDTAECDTVEPNVPGDPAMTEECTEGEDTLNCAGDDAESADETAGRNDGSFFEGARSGCRSLWFDGACIDALAAPEVSFGSSVELNALSARRMLGAMANTAAARKAAGALDLRRA